MIRHKRIRVKIKGTANIPRVSVFRSNRHLFAQVIDDAAGKTLVSVHDIRAKKGKHEDIPQTGGKTAGAALLGETLALEAKKAGISKIVFDRGGFKYHGRIKAFAEGLRRGGLKF